MELIKSVIILLKSKRFLKKFELKQDNPFKNNTGHLLIFCCHHKVGTSWFAKILPSISAEYKIPLVQQDQLKLPDGPAIFFQDHSEVNLSGLENYRGAHIIRDLRDIVVSGYYYHLWTREKWAKKPMNVSHKDLNENNSLLPINKNKDMSYQQFLNSLSREEGLLVEINRASKSVIKDIMKWDYNNKDFFEFKYEDIMENEDKIFQQLFHHYGFNDVAIETSIKLAKQFSFKNRTGRDIGDIGKKSHMRSGKLQQWKQEFNEEHKALFKKLHGEDLIKLGYEKNLNW